MGLFSRRPRRYEPKPLAVAPNLPPLVAPPVLDWDSPTKHSPGYYIWSTVAYQGRDLVQELRQVPNASRSELFELITSINGICTLARELKEVDGELIKASNGELGSELDEMTPWEWRRMRAAMMIHGGRGIPKVFHYNPSDAEGGDDHYREAQERARKWAQQSLAEPQLSEFIRLLDRRCELRESAQQAFDGFQDLKAQIEAASRRAKLLTSAGRIDPDAGGDARPELALENLKSAQDSVTAVTAGLDAAYPLEQPALEP